MRRFSFAVLLACSAALAADAHADTITTTFARGEGFTSRSFDDVTLPPTASGFTATFSGGFQEQSFDGPAYASGPDAYFFLNGANFVGSFNRRPITDNTDVGRVTFNRGVTDLSFFAADRANGTPSLRVLGLDGSVLATETITETEIRGNPASQFTFSSADLNGLIGGVEFDNAGPAGNPPYVIAIDNFSATAVPEPTSLVGLASLATLGLAARRRRG